MIQKVFDRLLHHKRISWVERHFNLVLIMSIIVMILMSLAIGMNQSVWFDEAYSIMVAKQPIGQVLHLAAVDTHPPFYYLLLKAWAGVFGWSELALRSLSVVAMGGAATFGILLVKRMFGVRVALATLPFVVFAPFLLRYGFEIRMYAFASLIGIAATYVIVQAVDAKTKGQKWLRYSLYAVLVALGVYTLYYTALLWTAHLLWLIWLTYKEKQPLLKQPWILAFAASIVLFLPWLPIFLKQMNNGALAAIGQEMTLENLMGIVSFNFVYQPSWQLDGLLSLLIVFVIGALSFIVVRAVKSVKGEQGKYLLLLGGYLLVPIIILTTISLFRPMYVERYLAHVVLGGTLFVGVCVALATTRASSSTLKTTSVLLFVVLVVGVAHLIQVGNYNFQRLQKPDLKHAAAVMQPCDPHRTILAADPYVAIELAYYMPDCQIHFYSKDEHLGGGYAPLSDSPLRIGNPAAQIDTHKELYYVHYDRAELDIPSSMQQMSEEQFGSLSVAHFSAE